MGTVAILLAVLLPGCLILRLFWHPIYGAYKRSKYTKELAAAVRGEIAFVGDSITDAYPLAEFYPDTVIYNRGISGDATFHVLRRMDGVYALRPSVIVLLIGTNDFMNERRDVADVAEDYRAILQGIKENCPGAAVICQSVYPGGASPRCKMSPWLREVVSLNAAVRQMAAEYGYIYADVFSFLVAEGTEHLNPRYSQDGVHPNTEGYAVVTACLKPLIETACRQQNESSAILARTPRFCGQLHFPA